MFIPDLPIEDLEQAEPRVYFINAACVRWAQRTGRPLIEWLWNDDLDTRLPEELMESQKEART